MHTEILQDIPTPGLLWLVNEPIGTVNGIDQFPYLYPNFQCILRCSPETSVEPNDKPRGLFRDLRNHSYLALRARAFGQLPFGFEFLRGKPRDAERAIRYFGQRFRLLFLLSLLPRSVRAPFGC